VSAGFDLRRLLGFIVLAQGIAAGAAAQAVVGVLGDSISAEYQAPQSNYRRGLEGFGWVEILARVRASAISFGAYDPTLDTENVPGGYAHDYAVGGSMVVGNFFPQQVSDAAADVTAGALDAVVIWLGANDFSVRVRTGGSFDLNDPSFQTFQTTLVDALVGALDTLIAAGATDIVLAKIQLAAPNRADVVSATNDTNAKLAAAALRPQVTFFDPLSELAARADAARTTVRLDGLTVSVGAAPSSALVAPPGGVTPTQCGFNNTTFEAACPTPAYQAYFLTDDGAHPTTPIQGLFANAMLAALSSRGFTATPLTDAEILAVAGIAPPPPAPLLQLAWSSLASKCKATTSVCRVKGKLLARNLDSAVSQPTSLSFLLSADPSADAGDLVIGGGAIRALSSGKKQKLKLNATLPPGVSTSGKYVITVDSSPAGGQAMVHGPLN
jgi:hypothetical protein